MKKCLCLLLLFLFGCTNKSDKIQPQKSSMEADSTGISAGDHFDSEKEYLKRFAPVSVSEQRKYGIPASVILSIACRQSIHGTNGNVAFANNHFGLPCSFDWSGETSTSYGGYCCRKYENAWVSFRDFSLYVTTGKYKHLTKIPKTDYKNWINGIEKCGFSYDENFNQEVLDIIEKYKLNQLDKLK